MIKVENISVKLDDFKTNYSLDVDNGEWIGIIGQSGSGKSTLLNLIAGFIYTDSGSIRINSVEMNSTHPSERPVSCLFQENNLFPHLRVYENIAIGISPRLKLNASENLMFYSKIWQKIRFCGALEEAYGLKINLLYKPGLTSNSYKRNFENFWNYIKI